MYVNRYIPALTQLKTSRTKQPESLGCEADWADCPFIQEQPRVTESVSLSLSDIWVGPTQVKRDGTNIVVQYITYNTCRNRYVDKYGR